MHANILVLIRCLLSCLEHDQRLRVSQMSHNPKGLLAVMAIKCKVGPVTIDGDQGWGAEQTLGSRC